MYFFIKKLLAAAALVTALTDYFLTLSVAVTSNPVGKKVGIVTVTDYPSVLFFGADANIQRATQNGGIIKISTVDIKHKSILGIIVSYETIVIGG